MKMKFYTDPGHAWLEVDRLELFRLGIESKISGYSYQNKDKVYLEEDCDCAIFFEALFGSSEWYKDQANKEKIHAIPTKHTNNDSKVRRYEGYKSWTV